MLDPLWLRTFLLVAEVGGFSRAAQRLGVGQSTVSQHVRKLENAVGRQLFRRDTHSVQLTGDGEAMTGFARTLLDNQQRALAYFHAPEPSGEVRLGVSEDLVLSRLPRVLRRFRRSHPRVDIELTLGLSVPLHQRMLDGELDLVLVKRPHPEVIGRVLWRDELVWATAPDTPVESDEPLTLITYPEPSITRRRALDSLSAWNRPWRAGCTSDRLNGLCAAARAGLGTAVFARALVPDGLVVVQDELPALGEVAFVLAGRQLDRPGPVSILADVIESWAGEAQPEQRGAAPDR